MSVRDKDPNEVLRRWFEIAQAYGEVDHVLRKRDSERAFISTPIDVRTKNGDRYTARLRDVSVNGLGIICSSKILNWTEVRVFRAYRSGEYVDGIVVHCTETVGGFFRIGIGVDLPEELLNRAREGQRQATRTVTQMVPYGSGSKRHPWPKP